MPTQFEIEFEALARDAFAVAQPALYATLQELVALGEPKSKIMMACHWERYVGNGRADIVRNMVDITIDVLYREKRRERRKQAKPGPQS